MYDPSSARFISQDPLGFDAGDPNLYRYVFNSPTNSTDPTGLLVEGVFDQDTGIIYLRDTDTGETLTFGNYFSGSGSYRNNPLAEGLQNEGPLPRGTYEILYHPREGFYRLDLKDGSRNDRVDQEVGRGRNEFRLHYPGASIGCISSNSNADPERENWQQIVDLLENTNKEVVTDGINSRGNLLINQMFSTVMPAPPVGPLITKFGEIEVTGSGRGRDVNIY